MAVEILLDTQEFQRLESPGDDRSRQKPTSRAAKATKKHFAHLLTPAWLAA
jgi:hypothetical protein